MNERFPMNAATFAEAKEYLVNRAIQMLADGYKLSSITPHENWGVLALFEKDHDLFQSMYVLAPHRHKGHLLRYAQSTAGRVVQFVTSPDCGLEMYFHKNHIRYRMAGLVIRRREYQEVAKFYGYRKAKRSGVPFMNHIDEGLAVLAKIGASINAKLAYCLHPLFQDDKDLAASFPRLREITDNPEVIALALEYRNITNAYPAHRTIGSLDEIHLGPLSEIRDMLIADKVQNYKDFLQYHRDTHPRSKELNQYFWNWLHKLGVSWDQFEEWRRTLNVELSS